MGLFKKIKKGVSKAVKNLAIETKKTIKDPVKAIKHLAKSIVRVGGFSVLLPFKGTMKHQLNKKGIKHSNKIDDISLKFFENIVRKNKSFESYCNNNGLNYENYIEGTSLVKCYYGECKGSGGASCCKTKDGKCSCAYERENFIEDVTEIIKAIIDFFKKVKEKKEQGTATPEEKEIAISIEKEEKEIARAVDTKPENNSSVMGIDIGVKEIIIFVLLVFIASKALKGGK